MRLNQVTVPLIDYQASLAFYRTLGLRQIVDSPPRYARFECPASDGGEPATFSIEFVEGWRADGGAGAWPEIFFEVDDIDAEVKRLRAAGLAVSDVADQSWLWREAELTDPAGVRIKLYHAGANRRFPPWRIS